MSETFNWQLKADLKHSQKLNDQVSALAAKLKAIILTAQTDDEKKEAVFHFYRKYYTLSLKKKNLEAGINKSPTRDIVLDYPWKELNLDRFQCMKIWEKINL